MIQMLEPIKPIPPQPPATFTDMSVNEYGLALIFGGDDYSSLEEIKARVAETCPNHHLVIALRRSHTENGDIESVPHLLLRRSLNVAEIALGKTIYKAAMAHYETEMAKYEVKMAKYNLAKEFIESL